MKKLPPIVYLVTGFILVWVVRGCFHSLPALQTSIGERILFTHNLSTESLKIKQEIAEAFDRQDYQVAIEKAERVRGLQPNDPEVLLAINNAKILQQKPDPKQVVTIPIVSSATNGRSTAVEVLRGAEIARMEIDRQGGINGKKILFKVYIDNNDRELAQKVAQKIVDDKHQLVIGHIDSNSSVAAAPIYQKAGVVMISPTSSTMDLKGMGNFIFRTVPNSEMMSKTLAAYVSKSSKKQKLGFCYDSKLTAGKTFKDAFIAEISKQNSEIISVPCDASDPEFSPQSIVKKMVDRGADALVLYFHINQDYQLTAAQNLARAAKQHQLPLFGSHSLVAPEILQSGQDFAGMVVVTPRHPDLPLAKNFRRIFKSTFGSEPTWREMLSYDAVKAAAIGLRGSDGTSYGLMKNLHDPNFVITDGSSGAIKFSHSGDRLVTPSIAQVKCEEIPCKFSSITEIVPNSNQTATPKSPTNQ